MASTANVQFISDADSRLLAKFTYFTTDGTQETGVTKVNVLNLKGRTWVLTVNAAPYSTNPQATFKPGEGLTLSDGNTGFVVSYSRAANVGTLVVVGSTGASRFNAASQNVVSAISNLSMVIDSTSQPTALLSLAGVSYSIPDGAFVQLQWAGAANADAMILTGQGYFGKNALEAPIPNNAGTPTGNLLLSTYGLANNQGYTLTLDLRKTQGWSARPGY